MPEMTIKVLVEGGKASPASMGQSLGSAGLNIGKVVADINAATKEFTGMKIPVKIIYDDKKAYRLEVGLPPASQLLKKEAKIDKGAPDRKAWAGDVTLEQVVKVAKQKKSQLLSNDFKKNVKEMLGVALSVGLTVDGKNPKEVQKEVAQGQHDSKIK